VARIAGDGSTMQNERPSRFGPLIPLDQEVGFESLPRSFRNALLRRGSLARYTAGDVRFDAAELECVVENLREDLQRLVDAPAVSGCGSAPVG
jgi:hypothetical protein